MSVRLSSLQFVVATTGPTAALALRLLLASVSSTPGNADAPATPTALKTHSARSRAATLPAVLAPPSPPLALESTTLSVAVMDELTRTTASWNLTAST